MGCFDGVHLGKRVLIGYYTGTLIIENRHGDKDLGKRYGERLMSLNVRDFQIPAVDISNSVMDSDGSSYHAWAVPLRLNQQRFSNELRYWKVIGLH